MIQSHDLLSRIEHLWLRIEMWLNLYAPQASHMLLPGASEQAIKQAEATMSIVFPEEFRASSHVHNGGYRMQLVTEMHMLSLQEIVAEWHMYQEMYERGTWSEVGIPYYFTKEVVRSGWQTGPIQPVWWHPHWIPIGRDRAGNNCCLDLAPAPGGLIGQIIDRDHEAGPSRVLASHFLEVLSTFTTDLEAGAYEDNNTGLKHIV